MLKYVDTLIGFREVPDEITLCINISNCPCNCKGCHSPYLAKDIGKPLQENLDKLIESNNGITCICFMGGDSDPWEIFSLARYIKLYYPKLKVAWYSGRDMLPKRMPLEEFDYIKLGPYIEDLGPLDSKTTNQKFYEVLHLVNIHGKYEHYLTDITYKFRK